MWIVSAYLIGPAAAHKELSYFSAHEHALGEIVRIPIRGKISYGLVVACVPAKEARQTVRSSAFSLQKISGTGKKILTNAFLHSAFEIAADQAVSVGSVLSALVSNAIFEKLEAVWEAPDGHATQPSSKTTYVLGSRNERLKEYVPMAEETVQKQRSFLLIAPTIVEVERLAGQFYKALLFHGGLTKKVMRERWNAIVRSKRPVIVVGSPIALSLPRIDWGAIVLERALARGYERSSRPHISLRLSAERIAHAAGARYVVGSAMFPVEEAESNVELKSQKEAIPVAVIDMSEKNMVLPGSQPRRRFELFSPAAKQKIQSAIHTGENVLLVTARYGLALGAGCDDCGAPLSCPRCGGGLVLHEERQPKRISLVEAYIKRWFECCYCGLVEKVHILCPICGSWRLSMSGIGLTLVAREAEKQFSSAELFIADEKVMENSNKAKKLAETFERSRSAILCATEGMLPYLSDADPRPLAVIVSIDSMLYVPEYSSSESTLAFLRELQGIARELLIQTRLPAHPVIEALSKGQEKKWRDRELVLRQTFGYPPFAVLLRLTVSGSPAGVGTQVEAILEALDRFAPIQYAGRSVRKSFKRAHILLRLPSDQWINQKLLAFIRTLPPSVEVRVNPRTLISD